MNSVLVFTGRSAVDVESFRWQVLRVPEVSNALKEAQATLDNCLRGSLDLVSLMQTENKQFLSSGLWRSLVSQVVQIGLYRRYQKIYSQPRFLVGEVTGSSAFAVCIGKVSMAEAAIAFAEELNKKEEQLKMADVLIGHSLESASVYERVDSSYRALIEDKQVLELLEAVNKDYLLDQVITLGSAQSLGVNDSLSELGIVESVAMDPLLSWLWPYLKAA
jgi:acyl transferase domain-containing protein